MQQQEIKDTFGIYRDLLNTYLYLYVRKIKPDDEQKEALEVLAHKLHTLFKKWLLNKIHDRVQENKTVHFEKMFKDSTLNLKFVTNFFIGWFTFNLNSQEKKIDLFDRCNEELFGGKLTNSENSEISDVPDDWETRLDNWDFDRAVMPQIK
jgi:hypothetical protein